jgi:hypothetical protein
MGSRGRKSRAELQANALNLALAERDRLLIDRDPAITPDHVNEDVVFAATRSLDGAGLPGLSAFSLCGALIGAKVIPFSSHGDWTARGLAVAVLLVGEDVAVMTSTNRIVSRKVLSRRPAPFQN